jgi:hypothetical protein
MEKDSNKDYQVQMLSYVNILWLNITIECHIKSKLHEL